MQENSDELLPDGVFVVHIRPFAVIYYLTVTYPFHANPALISPPI